jgi:DNA mismatch endonuclease (patch repair protein)
MERQLRKKLPFGRFPDVHPAHTRIMKGVRGKGNKTTEARLRAAIISGGLSGWKLNFKGIRGSPDFYFPVEQLAVFADGCFWHGCKACGHVPAKNRPFWKAKIDSNRRRDTRTTVVLRRSGVSVLRIWEHEVRQSPKLCVNKIRARLTAKVRKGRKRELRGQ